MTPEEYLSQWALDYAKSRDAALKKIVGIEQKGTMLGIKYKDRNAAYEAMESLKDLHKAANNSIVVSFNTAENIKRVMQDWNKMAGKKLTLILINPLSKLETKWMVATHVHDSIMDKSSFRQGIKSMAENVEAITDEQIAELCRN